MGASEWKNLVIVVDDSATARAAAESYLRAGGCEVLPVPSAEQCLREMAKRSPRLVLMDLHLEALAGDQACLLIKGSPQFSRVPVIITTSGDAPDEEVMRTWRAGADDFLPKPIRPAQLEAKLAAIRAAALSEPSAPIGQRPLDTLLFVDDSRFLHHALGGMLEHAGFQLLYAETGEQALELAGQFGGRVGACLIDLRLPDRDGLSVLRALRGMEQLAGKPMLLMSAADPPPQAEEEARRLASAPILDKRELPLEMFVAQIQATLRRGDVANDLRVTQRVPFFSVVEFRPRHSTEWMSGFSYNLSPGGIFIRTLTPPDRTMEIELKLRLAAGPQALCLGQVVWANPFAGRVAFSYPVGMAIRFTELSPLLAEEVGKIVRAGGARRG